MFKKILRIVVLVFVFVPSVVFAQTTTDSFKSTFITKYSFIDSNGRYGNFQHFKRRSDSQIAFCIEPGLSLSTGSYNGYYDLGLEDLASKVNITKEELNLAALYAYFGYGHDNRKGDDWIVATQALIWKMMGRDFQFTSQYKPDPDDKFKYVIPTPIEIQSHIDEIEKDVNAYLAYPDFKTNHAKIGWKGSYNFGNLKGFQVTDCLNCSYKISGSDLLVSPNSREEGTVYLKKEASDYETSFVVYESSRGQNVLVPGKLEPLSASVSFEVVTGKFRLKKYDADTKACKPREGGSLKGSVYKLYKEDGTFVKDLIIDDDCNAEVDNLEMGSYYIKEYEAGAHYKLDENIYSFSLSTNVLEKELIVYDEIYVGQVHLHKYDSKTKSCKAGSSYASLEGAIYGLYNKKGELLQELVIDQKCSASSLRNLMIDTYYIQEIKAPKGYKLDSKKYSFEVTEENADIGVFLDVYDDIYKTRLVVNKNYLYFDDIKPESGAVFEVYYKSNETLVTTFTIGQNGFAEVVLPYGEYVIHQVNGKMGYHFVSDILLTVDETTASKTYMSLLNKPYRGTLEFYKTDTATGKFLPNVLIEVYNEEDKLVYRGVTDEYGKIVVTSLPYGKYSIVEKKALKDYFLFRDKLYFEIKEDEQVSQVFMENERIVHVPDTGKSSLNYNFIISFVLLVLGIGIFLYGKAEV